MGYKKRRYRKRYKKKYKGKLGKEVAKLKREVGVPERKFISNALATAANNINNTVGYNNFINGVAQGDSVRERTGRKISITMLEIRFLYGLDPLSTHSQVRTVLVWDKMVNGTLTIPAFNDIIVQSANNGITSVYNPKVVPSRFQILKDFTINLTDTGSNRTVYKTKRIYFKGGRDQLFLGTGNGYVDIQSGGICIFFISDQTINGPDCFFSYNIRFRDN